MVNNLTYLSFLSTEQLLQLVFVLALRGFQPCLQMF